MRYWSVLGCTGLFGSRHDKSGTGNHLFARQDWPEVLAKNPAILRPHNLGTLNSVGTGLVYFEKPASPGKKLAVINLAGRVFMERARCPFRTVDTLLSGITESIPVVVDFHAEATSEKLALFWHLAGRVAAVVGTHTHVQTSDERILPGGTATISDIGMTGASDGVLGVDKDTIVGRFIKGYSDKFLCGTGGKKLEGVFVEINDENKAIKIERFRREVSS